MTPSLRRLAHAGVLVLLAACSAEEEKTGVVVVLDADSLLQVTATEVRVRVEGSRSEGSGGMHVDSETISLREEDASWPVTVRVRPHDGDASRTVSITATLVDGGSDIVTVRAVTGFRKGELTVLPLSFDAACRDQKCDDAGQSCRMGWCIEPAVPAEYLGMWSDYDAPPAQPVVPSVVAGAFHSCAVEADGKARCWGAAKDGYTQIHNGIVDIVPGGTFQHLTAGEDHTCGLRTNGTVTCWGDGKSGQTAAPPGVFDAVVAGAFHSCGLRPDGKVQCWGLDEAGQASPPDRSFEALTAGGDVTCGATAAGKWQCWGARESLPDPLVDSSESLVIGLQSMCEIGDDGAPACWAEGEAATVAASPKSSFTKLAVGGFHACGLSRAGEVECWGVGSESLELCDSRRYKYLGPEAIRCGQARAPEGKFTDIAAGRLHTCAIRHTGGVVCWGDDLLGQVRPVERFLQIAAGADQTCGVTVSGAVRCWGRGYLGVDPPADTFAQVDVAQNQTCGLTVDGRVRCWQAGCGYSEGTPYCNVTERALCDDPACLEGATGPECDAESCPWIPLVEMAMSDAGPLEICGIDSEGDIQCRSSFASAPPPLRGPFVALGITGGNFPFPLMFDPTEPLENPGQEVCVLTPDDRVICRPIVETRPEEPVARTGTPVARPVLSWGAATLTLDSVTKLATDAHSCALHTDGGLECWGNNEHGQAEAPAGTFSDVCVASGPDAAHSCGVRADGTVQCWGSNNHGQSRSRTGRYVSVTCGPGFTCALRADHAVDCWGDEQYGRSQPPDGKFTAVDPGMEHSCAIRADDGELECWGSNGFGQTDAPRGTYVAVSSAYEHSCAIRADDGELECWGDSDSESADLPQGPFSQLELGRLQSCALRTDGTLACWNHSNEPEGEMSRVGGLEVPTDAVFTSFALGPQVGVCGVRPDGAVDCWGEWPCPRVAIESHPGPFTAAALDDCFACGLRPDGSIEGWGPDAVGELGGLGLDLPVGGPFVQLATGGGGCMCALRADGSVACAGGCASAPPDGLRFVSIALTSDAGGTEIAGCGVTVEDHVRCWGDTLALRSRPPP